MPFIVGGVLVVVIAAALLYLVAWGIAVAAVIVMAALFVLGIGVVGSAVLAWYARDFFRLLREDPQALRASFREGLRWR